MSRLHVWIGGRVQGVFFRETTRQVAQELGLVGWVKNLPDGRVEAVFQGDAGACGKALEWARIGPPSARVTSVEEGWEEEDESLNTFKIVF